MSNIRTVDELIEELKKLHPKLPILCYDHHGDLAPIKKIESFYPTKGIKPELYIIRPAPNDTDNIL